MKIKLNLIILCLLLFLAGGSSVIHADNSWSYPTSKPDGKFGGGSGSWYDPYLINNAQQLADLAYKVNKGEYYKGKYFKLTTDITLNDNVLKADGTPNTTGTFKEWTPIGEYGSVWDDDFMGTFDGCGHTIRGLYINKSAGDDESHYLGLFGSIKNATLKNINLEDCLISVNETKGNATVNIGVLCGTSYQSSCVNVKVSKAYVSEENPGNIKVGGMIGRTYYSNGDLSGPCLANSSFDGTISIINCHGRVEINVGGLIGYYGGYSGEGIINCTCKGKLYVDSRYPVNITAERASFMEYVGGILGRYSGLGEYGEYHINNCVNYMDIHYQTKKDASNYINVQSVVAAFTPNTGNDLTLKNCVNFGNVYVGNNGVDNGYSYNYLFLKGMQASEMADCANYGTFIFLNNENNNTSPKCLICMDARKYTRCISIQTVNYIPKVTEDAIIYPFKNGNKGVTDCHYYFKTNSPEGPFYADGDQFTRHEDLTDFTKTKPFFSDGEWGVIPENGNAFNGYPMPVVCGGVSTGYNGDGQSESTAYKINTEEDLNKLKEYVNNGSTFDGKYFKLGSDIYITGLLDECIGKDYENPFMGHFDGDGHAIVGLRKSLFGYMYGKVKNLALVDCDIWDGNYATALARQVGGTDKKAEVSNCYVSGTISFSTPWNQQGYASTFAFQVAPGSSIHDCYFKGRFIVKEQTFSTYNVAGIAIYDNNRAVNTSAESPEGIFNCYASFDVKVEASVWQPRYTYGISSDSSNDESKGNYFVCSDNGVHQSNQGGIKLNSESELNEKFKDNSAWLQGVYRPVLASAKNYAATTPEATPKTVYFDAIPEANPTPNYFYNISIEDPYSDVSLWNLPNMAVYVSSEKKDYITNGNLVPAIDFKYKRTTGATATAGQLRYDLTQSEKGYHMICLPGNVERTDLPDGAKVMIVGKIQTVEGKEQVNVVMVDTIPAGVPCMLYVPTTTVTTGTTIPLVMRSGIVSQPTEDANYSNMKGTFSATTATDACVTAKYSNGETLPVFEKTSGSTSVQPFTAWLAGATTANVQIVDYVLLDEENEAMTVTLAGLNSTSESSKTTNVKMRRTVKLGQWNTICLPFDLTKAEVETVFGAGTKVEELSSLTYDETSQSYTLVFAAVTETDSILMKAGVPYLIKPGTAKTDEQTSVQLYGFSNKKIICPADKNYMFVPAGKEVTNTAKSTSLTMQGEYNHRTITPYEATDGKSIYVISGNKIYHVNSEVEMKGFRCYFVAEESTTGSTEEGTGEVGTSMFSNARVLHSDGTSTDLRLIKAEPAGDADAVYDLLGRKGDGQTKGVVIKNGKKVLKK